MLNLETVRATAKAVVAEQGADFTYITKHEASREISCFYVPTTSPLVRLAPWIKGSAAAATTGCLVGRILGELGAMTPALAASRSGIRGAFDRGQVGIPAPQDVQDYLAALQSVQDSGETWGVALAHAESMVADD